MRCRSISPFTAPATATWTALRPWRRGPGAARSLWRLPSWLRRRGRRGRHGAISHRPGERRQCRRQFGVTPLMLAAQLESTQILQALLARAAQVARSTVPSAPRSLRRARRSRRGGQYAGPRRRQRRCRRRPRLHLTRCGLTWVPTRRRRSCARSGRKSSPRTARERRSMASSTPAVRVIFTAAGRWWPWPSRATTPRPPTAPAGRRGC